MNLDNTVPLAPHTTAELFGEVHDLILKNGARDLRPHDLASAFPLIVDEPLQSLEADIAANGVREPIILWENGVVLDGWHRYTAALQADLETIPARQFRGNDDQAAQCVISANLMRRHLSPSERAEARLDLEDWKKSSTPKGKYQTPSARQMAREAGVSHTTMNVAIKARQEPADEQVEQVDTPEVDPVKKQEEREAKSDARTDLQETVSVDGDLDEMPEPLTPEREMELTIDSLRNTIQGQAQEIIDLKETVLFLRDQGNDETAMRERVLNNQRQEIRVLKAQVAEWQMKYDDARREGVGLRKKVEHLEAALDAAGREAA